MRKRVIGRRPRGSIVLLLLSTLVYIASAFMPCQRPGKSILSLAQRNNLLKPTLETSKSLLTKKIAFLASSTRIYSKQSQNKENSPIDTRTATSTTDNELLQSFSSLTKPVQNVLDDATGGWALSYADLSKAVSIAPWSGPAFLATNLAYALAGVALIVNNSDPLFGVFTDLTAIASFNYHYNQIQAADQVNLTSVRIALLVDYAFASIAILWALVYAVTLTTTASIVPVSSLVAGGLGTVFLLLCWVYERGFSYMILHSMWHLCSAYAGYEVGRVHSDVLTTATIVASNSIVQ